MADSNIGALPLAPSVEDDSLLVMEQQGTAMKVTGYLLKGYAKQGVELEFKDDLAQSQEAASQAQSAANAVVNMTVEAHASGTATVTKSMKNGKVNLNFGLPEGAQGPPGPAGATGPRGPQGAPGNGLTLLGHYDAEDELRMAVSSPEAGEAYSVGTELPYDTYIFDGVTLDWKNYGPLSGGGSAILPENVVTTPGGAELAFDSGDGPHTVTFTDEEEPPLTAEDIVYGDSSVGEALDGLKSSVGDGKALVASAITDKGVPTAQDATFQQMAENIGQISADGADTSDATATPGDILAPKTAYTRSGKVEGIIPSLPAQTITPGTADRTIANGQYLAGTQTIQGDTNLVSSNIRRGVSIFGVPGAMESEFAAVLTVTADIGAVVTATCGDTTVEALSTTGKVVLELPIEGTWKVTAVRGMAQYNTATIEVTNQYSAELTAVLHVQYFMKATALTSARYKLSAASVGNSYAIFGGGCIHPSGNSKDVDAYNAELTHTSKESLCELDSGASASTEKYAFFIGSLGGYGVAFDASLFMQTTNTIFTNTTLTDFSGSSVGEYAIFAGGYDRDFDSVSDYAHSIDKNMTKGMPTKLSTARNCLAAAANEAYALFGGGLSGTSRMSTVDAYNASLTRSIATPLSSGRGKLAAARAGNYVLFAGGGNYSKIVDAYDLFLTHTTVEALGTGREGLAGTTVRDFAIFGGGVASGGEYPIAFDVYDPYLVRTAPKGQGYGGELAAAAIGDYALFGGGRTTAPLSYVNAFKYT